MDDNFDMGIAPHPIDSVVYLTDVFTSDQCKEIIDIGTTHWSKSQGGVGGEKTLNVDTNIRNVTVYTPEALDSTHDNPNEFDEKWRGNFAKNRQDALKFKDNRDPGFISMETRAEHAHRGLQDWLCERIMGNVKAANDGNDQFPGWKFEINGFLELPQIMHYAEGSGEYKWHIDIGPMPPYSRRKLSYTIFLNSRDEYDGGELIFKLENDDYHREFYDVGGMAIFPTYLLHKVAPVTRGSRYALVGWIHGDLPFR